MIDPSSGNARFVLVAVAIVVSQVQPILYADTETPRVVLGPRVSDLTVEPRMNAAGRNLRGSTFIGQDLTGAIFDDCHLDNVRIFQCNLSGASFRGTVFEGSKVGECQLSGADFTDATVNGSGFEGQCCVYKLELSLEQLISTRSYKEKNLSRCVITRTGSQHGIDGTPNFAVMNLEGAHFIRGDFRGCDFSGARINRACFDGVYITFDQLISTSDYQRGYLDVRVGASSRDRPGLTGKCDFSRIDLRRSTLTRISEDANFTGAIIRECAFRACLTQRQLYTTQSYKDGDLMRLSCAYVDFSNCRLVGQNLSGSAFAQCQFYNANFEDAVITGVDFVHVPGVRVGCVGLTTAQIKSTWNYKHGRMAGIELPEDIAEALWSSSSDNDQ